MTTPLTPEHADQGPQITTALRAPVVRGDDDEVSLVALLSVVHLHRKLVIGTALVFMVLVVGLGLASSRTWSSGAAILPQTRQGQAAGMSIIAAQLGLNLPGGEAAQAPAFYAELLLSRQILGALAESGVTVSGRHRALADLYNVSGPSAAVRRENTIQALQNHVSVSVSTKTGVIRLKVSAPEADAAKQLADQMLRELSLFNTKTRQSQAAAERRFIEQRLAEARNDLRESEGQLKYFMQRNRTFGTPELQFEQNRLQREVTLRQEIYSGLSQAFERARIDEVRDSPVFTVVETPEVPVRPDSRGLARNGLLALVGGSIVGIMLAFGREFARRNYGMPVEERPPIDLRGSHGRRSASVLQRLQGRLFRSGN